MELVIRFQEEKESADGGIEFFTLETIDRGLTLQITTY